jgi:hypothetical protein
MPRCCIPIPGEFEPSYASVLVAGCAPDALRDAVRSVERGRLRSSLTAWCSTCGGPYLLTGALGLFPSASAHHAHMVAAARARGQ